MNYAFDFILLTLSINLGYLCSAQASSGDDNGKFPTMLGVSRQLFRNWAQAIELERIWTVAPHSAQEIVLLANWASANGYSLRPRGYMHNWSPLVLTPDQEGSRSVILIDTTVSLTDMKIVSRTPPAVQVQTGASLEALLTYLEEHGFGITSHPAPGDISVGGMLAIGAHGTGVPISGINTGSFGSISNLVLSLEAVVWNQGQNSFELKLFQRTDPETKALLTNLGRILITKVTLRVQPNVNLRCLSRTDILAEELFAHPSRVIPGVTETISSFIDQFGSVETIWFPFTTRPWLKIWSVCPVQPSCSRFTDQPFNYPFSDNIPPTVSNAVEKILAGEWDLAPASGRLAYAVTSGSLKLGMTSDLWGSSKNLLLYVKPTTLRVTANGYAVITSRSNVQLVISQFVAFYQTAIEKYESLGLYPINGPLEIRVSGLDNPADLGIPNAEAPSLSAIRPVEGRPDLNTAVWFDCLTFPSTPDSSRFLNELESFLFSNYAPSLAIVRPEWSKGWAYTDKAGWSNLKRITHTIPKLYQDWNYTTQVFNKYDPMKIFSNPLLNMLFQ